MWRPPPRPLKASSLRTELGVAMAEIGEISSSLDDDDDDDDDDGELLEMPLVLRRRGK